VASTNSPQRRSDSAVTPVRPENANATVITGVSRDLDWRRQLALGAAEVG
jgi:hypothetical protein